MFERLAGLRPGIKTRYDLVRQERAVVGPHVVSMPIVRELVLDSSEDRLRIEALRDSVRYICSQGLVNYLEGSWIAALPARLTVTYDVRKKRALVFGGRSACASCSSG